MRKGILNTRIKSMRKILHAEGSFTIEGQLYTQLVQTDLVLIQHVQVLAKLYVLLPINSYKIVVFPKFLMQNYFYQDGRHLIIETLVAIRRKFRSQWYLFGWWEHLADSNYRSKYGRVNPLCGKLLWLSSWHKWVVLFHFCLDWNGR